MIKILLDKFSKWATGKKIFILLAIFIVFNVLVWPRTVARIEALSGGVSPLDLQFSYSPEKAYHMIDAYGEEGREFYMLIDITADLIYPLSTSLLFALLLTFIVNRAFDRNPDIKKITGMIF